jgi:hypothetical protein
MVKLGDPVGIFELNVKVASPPVVFLIIVIEADAAAARVLPYVQTTSSPASKPILAVLPTVVVFAPPPVHCKL